MLISQLPPGLKELAELRRNNFANKYGNFVRKYGSNEQHLTGAFAWGFTAEGWEFWHEINKGNFTQYYGCKVVNVKPKEPAPKEPAPKWYSSPSTVINWLKRQNPDNDYHL